MKSVFRKVVDRVSKHLTRIDSKSLEAELVVANYEGELEFNSGIQAEFDNLVEKNKKKENRKDSHKKINL